MQKLPPNMKETWVVHTVKRTMDRSTLIDFEDWRKDKADAHVRMKYASLKPKTETRTTTASKIETITKVFGSTASSSHQSSNWQGKVKQLPNCVACKGKHPLWRRPVFRKRNPWKEQALWQTTIHASNPIFRFDSVYSPASVQKMQVEARTTPFCTGPRGFSQSILSLAAN